MAGIVVSIKAKNPGGVRKILEGLDGRKIRRTVAKQGSFVIQQMVKRQFATQQDPYGKRWKRKKVPDGRPVLTGETRQLRRNISSRTTTSGFRIHANTPYASFHQSGTGRMPQRKIFPVSSDGLPRKWKQTISAIAGVQIRKLSR